MKKLYYGMIAIFVCFFIFSLNIKADDIEYKVNMFDTNVNQANPLGENVDVFNYFEEKKNNTEFYQFLNEKGLNITSYLGVNSSYKNYTIFIFNKSEIDYLSELGYSSFGDYSTIEFDHVIMLVYSGVSLSSNNDNLLIGGYKDNNDSVGRSTYFYFFNGGSLVKKTSDTVPCCVESNSIFKYLSNYKFSYSWSSSGWWLWKKETYQGTNFSYLFSKIYYSSIEVKKTSNLTLNLQYACFGNYCYGTKNVDSSLMFDNNLEYLVDFPILSSKYSFQPLLNMFNYYNSKRFDSIPSTYQTATFDLSNNLSLFPIKACTVKDYQLYMYTSSAKNVTLYLHTIDDNDSLGYLASYYSTYQTEKAVLYNINPLFYLKDIMQSNPTKENKADSEFINYYYRFMGEDNKAKYVIYYNPECYAISESYEEVTFPNVKTGNDITFTGDSSTTDWKDPENVNSSNTVDFFDNNVDVSNVIGGLKKVSASFVTAGIEIVSLATSLFYELPDEVSSILLGGFLIVILIGVIKILKNIL